MIMGWTRIDCVETSYKINQYIEESKMLREGRAIGSLKRQISSRAMREFNEFFLPPNIYTQDAEQYSSQALRQRQMQQMEENGGRPRRVS
ncbi:unnamed protein product [Gongylonema pulchrum]|uniref:Uncharacterized protein n=1 Tax=Gongylonema pulchrum TaxID=637853 RepID=A0A183EEM4_9BILA|nr:unnamed protein product [Gongylonema pulchrum]